MKRMTALLLSLAMLLVLCACGGETGTPDTQTPAGTTPVVESPQTGGEPTAEEVKGVTMPSFTINVGGTDITNETMAEYPVYQVQATSVNSAGTESTCVYVGFALSDVLAAAGVESYTTVTAAADDGYEVEVDQATAAAPTTLVAISKDGEQFKSSPWFAPCSSGTTGDYLKGMVAIAVDGGETQQPAQSGESGGETGGVPEIQDRTDKVEFAPYSFLVNGTEVTNDTLAGLSIYKIDATVTNSAGETSTSTYTGYRLSDVLAACGAEGYTSVKAVANDGYETELDLESADSEYTLLAIEKDKETGEEGTVWVAPCLETSSKAYCKLVVEIVAQ